MTATSGSTRPHDTTSERARQLAALKAAHSVQSANLVDESEAALAEEFILPGGENPAEEAGIDYVPELADEFTCASCFMVRHRSQLVREEGGAKFCSECEG